MINLTSFYGKKKPRHYLIIGEVIINYRMKHSIISLVTQYLHQLSENKGPRDSSFRFLLNRDCLGFRITFG